MIITRTDATLKKTIYSADVPNGVPYLSCDIIFINVSDYRGNGERSVVDLKLHVVYPLATNGKMKVDKVYEDHELVLRK